MDLPEEGASRAWLSEDGRAMLAAAVLLAGCLLLVRPAAKDAGDGGDAGAARVLTNAAAAWIGKPGQWSGNPLDAWRSPDGTVPWKVAGACAACLVAMTGTLLLGGVWPARFVPGAALLLGLATVAFVIAQQKSAGRLGLEYALWALLAGLLVANTVGVPGWVRPALRTELYIKTGLVLMGAELLLGRLLELGVPGLFVAWVVTPVVLVTTFWFGQRVLRIESPSLNIVISADMSVCGVSAAIATAAACRAKKEELSLAIGMSLAFTVVMMVVMPALIRMLGLGPDLGGAWIGGTIDSSGAVAAAGAMLGDEALKVATTVKLIQNVLIGFVAFAVAVYWARVIAPDRGDGQVGWGEIWRRFPKFVFGFVGASAAFSALHAWYPAGPGLVDATIGTSRILREWLFCMAFVSIGLSTELRVLGRQLAGGKPLILYLAGQALNLVLTLAMAWLMFRIVFPPTAGP